MRYYFIKYYRDFENTYVLRHAPKEMLLEMVNNGFRRITRREAIRFCSLERIRERYEPSCAGYADRCVYPIEWQDETGDIPMRYNYDPKEYIVTEV